MNPTRRMIQALFLCCMLISVHLSSPSPAPASAAPVPPTATPLPDLPITLAGPAAQPPVPNAPLAIDTITTIACTGTCPPTPDYPDPSLVGQSYIVYFQVREDPSTPGSSPLGTVTVDDGEGHSCSRTLDSDPDGEYEEGWQWYCSLASTTVGTKTLTATFTPLDPLTYNGSSGTEPHTVDKADTTTAVTYLPPSPRACDVVTFTATVSPVPPAGGTPSAGLVTFFDGVVLLGSEALNASGQASYGTSALSVGSHVISAVYAGNDDYNGSASPAVNVTVAKANSTTSVTTLAPNPSTFGNAVTLRATVTGGCGTPTGLVSFNDGGAAVGTAALNASGVADLVLSNLAAGTHQITAVYHGDDTYLASMSSAHTHTVNKANTTTTLSGSPNPALAGQTVTFVATTTVAAPGSGAAAGTVTFWDGVAYLGSATLDGAGQALLSTSALGSGAHSITAQYGGNANLNGSTSAPFGLTVLAEADLVLEKTGPSAAVAGELLSYQLAVHNAGPDDAVNVVVTDTLPAALDYQIGTGGCALVGTGPQVLRCELGAVAAGQTRTIDIYARVRPDITPNSVAVNQAVVASAPADPDPADNTDTASTYLLGRADLSVLKFGLPGGQVAAGEHLTYTIVVDNLGPGYAHEVAVSDQMLSSGTFHVLALASDRAATCNLTPPCTFTGWLGFSCTLDDPLPPLAAGDSRWTLTLVVSADEAQTLSNTAEVAGGDADPNMANNHASVQHQVAAAADVELVKAAAGQVQVNGMPAGTFAPVANQVTAGGLLTYTLAVINHGPSTAHNVALQDRLPAWIELLSVSTTQGLCNLGQPGNPAAPQVCNLGTLASGRMATVTIVARVQAWLPTGHVFYNEAFVTSSSYDPLNTNDLALNLTTVDRWSDLEIAKAGQAASYPTHQGMVYTITVTNYGPSDAEAAVISDTLPAGLIGATWQCTASGGATCTAAGTGNINETVDLPVGGTVVYTLQAVMPRWRGLSNTATVTAGVGSNDPISPNNRATTSSAEPYALFLPLVVGGSGGIAAPDLIVAAIVADNNNIQVTIKNQGSAAVTNGFWVDVYIDPQTPPRAVNQVWGSLGQQGIVWGVTTGALPLQPGQTLTLTVGDAYYRADLSRVIWPLLPGTPVYAQVDSYNPASLYGLVLETHEIANGPYNNILGPVNAASSAGSR